MAPLGPPSERWPLLPSLGLFAAAWLALCWPWLSGAVTIPWDAKAHFYPQLQFLAQSLSRGEQPFWAPFVFSGSPQIADPQSLIFSPPFLGLTLLDPDPSFRAADAVVLGTLGAGGLAILMFFRDRGWHPAGALVAALAFTFGGSAAWRLQHVGQILSLAYLPIAVWLLARALERRSLLSGLLAGIVAGFMAAGRDQVAYLGVWVLIGFVLWRWLDSRERWRTVRRSLGPLLATAAAAISVALVPILLTMLLAEESNRPVIDYAGAGQGSLHPALLLTAFVPNLFGAAGPLQGHWGPPSPLWGPVDLFLARNMGQLYLGALPIAVLTTAALVRGGLWGRETRFFTIVAAVMLLYALGRYTPFFRGAFEAIPGVGLFRRPADATFVLGYGAAVLSGYLVHRWCRSDLAAGYGRRIAAALFVIVPVALCFLVPLEKKTFSLAAKPISSAALFLALALMVIALLPRLAARSALLAATAVTAVMSIDLAFNNGPSESTALPPAAYEVLRPDSRNTLIGTLKARAGETSSGARFDRIELTGLGFHWPNASLVHGFHNVLGYNPVRLGAYSAAVGAGDHVALPEQRTFSPLFPSYRSTLADLLGLRFIATGVPVERIDGKLRSGDLKLVAETGDGFIYENPRAGPRVSFARQAQAADFAALLRDGNWPAVDFATTVLVPPDAPGVERSGSPAAGTAGTARIVSYRNTEVVIEVDAATPGYVVLNDPWHPWWFATVDGADAQILRANVIFRTVAVPAGRHTVRFEFRPLAGAWRQIEAKIRRMGSAQP